MMNASAIPFGFSCIAYSVRANVRKINRSNYSSQTPENTISVTGNVLRDYLTDSESEIEDIDYDNSIETVKTDKIKPKLKPKPKNNSCKLKPEP